MPSSQTGLLNNLKAIGGRAAVYGIGGILVRAITLLLLPLYTRFLSSADYGLVGIITTITSVLTIVYPLGMHGALTQAYFDSRNNSDQRARVGTIWIGNILSSFIFAIIFEILGNGLCRAFFHTIPFSPYIRVAVWTAFFVTIGLVPMNLMQVREKPILYVALSLAAAVVTTGLVVFNVIIKQRGAYGFVYGTMIANGIMAIILSLLTLGSTRLRIEWPVLKSSLAYGLPLLPHGLAGWLLALSDRVILERHVALSDVGIYQLGYQIGSAITLAATAFNTAWIPFLFKIDKENGASAPKTISRITSYYAFLLSWLTLGLCLLCHYLIRFVTTKQFARSEQIVPWVACGMLMNGLYLIPVSVLFLKSKTRWIPIGTVLSGVVSIALNMWLIPKFGIHAAAGSVLIGNTLLLLLTCGLAHRFYPIPFDWPRIVMVLLLGASIVLIANFIPMESEAATATWRTVLWLCYPIVLLIVGFFPNQDLRSIRDHLGKRKPTEDRYPQ